jgi:branched-chain amino acid transport system substrate-binding protein
MIARQRLAAGLEDTPFILHGACQDQQFLDLAGDAAEGVIVASLYDPYSERPLTKAFNEKWDELYGELASDFNSYSYELVYILKQAVEAGATSENLSDYIAKVEYEGPSGMTVFDENGQATGKLPMPISVKDGQWATYSP